MPILGENMVNVTFSIPSELKVKMDVFDEINWSAVARKAFDQKVQDLEFMQRFTQKSTATEEDSIALARKIKQGMTRRSGA